MTTLPNVVHVKPEVAIVSTSDENIMREFVTLGQSLGDKPVARLIRLAILVKAMFSNKPRGVPIIFDGQPHTEFDEFVEAHFPISARTMRRWLAAEGLTETKFAPKSHPKKYFLTPPELYELLNKKYGPFDHDPCPLGGTDGLTTPWGWCNYINPPFCIKDAVNGGGPTAFVRKAIEEQQKGKTSVLVLPVQSYVNMLLEAGAELRPLGRVPWLEADTKEPMGGPTTVAVFVLRGKVNASPGGLNPMDDKERLRSWLETHWATARMAAKHCPDLVDRKVKNVSALLEELVKEGRTTVTEIPRVNRLGQYTLFTGKYSDKGRDWGEVKKKS
jgi:hypothetical protein